MRRFWRNQQGETILETLLASSLFAAIMLMAVAGETSLATERAHARRSTEVGLELQQAMDPLLRDINHAWGDPDPVNGAPPVTLLAPSGECPGGTQLSLAASTTRILWRIGANGSLVRAGDGQENVMRGSYSRICFALDGNGRTVRTTIWATDTMGQEHHLDGGATPEGVR